MKIDENNIPTVLRDAPRWCVWRYTPRNGSAKPTKLPLRIDGSGCSTTTPDHLTTFASVCHAASNGGGFSGIGVVLTTEQVGIDIDDSVVDGKLKPWALAIVKRFDSYTEISPSGTGVKIWVQAKYPLEGKGKSVLYQDGKVEVFTYPRYFAVTGKRYPDTPSTVNERQEAVDAMCRWLEKETAPKLPTPLKLPTVIADATARCQKYIDKCPDSISGQKGSDRALHAACECARFGLSDGETWQVMSWYNSTKCSPAWSDKELRHKIKDGFAKVQAAGEIGTRVRAERWTPPKPIYQPVPPPAESSALLTRINEMKSGKRVNIPWPYADNLTKTGKCLLPGTATVLCGGGGSTKSLWMSQCCIGWLEIGVKFAIFHLEDDRETHQQRALAQLARNAALTDDEWLRNPANHSLADDAYERYMTTLDALGASIWDGPSSDVSLDDLLVWVKLRADDGCRVIAVDPVTAADSGREPWIADKKFVMEAKRIMRASGASLIIVTHPRDGTAKGGTHLDNLAGGKAYNRFTESVLWLDAHDDEQLSVHSQLAGHWMREVVRVNRQIRIIKARHAVGRGFNIALYFDPRTLCFEERGIVADEKGEQ